MSDVLNASYVDGQGSVSAANLNAFVQTCANFTVLRTFVGLPGMQVSVLGGNSMSDGLQGVFFWNATTTAADDDRSIIRPTGVQTGAWVRNSFTIVIPGLIILTPSGGDDGPILASLAEPVLLTGGTFEVQTNSTVPVPVQVIPGTLINVTTGKTLTLSEPLSAVRGPLFTNALSGEGTVVLSETQIAYPEWWGADTGQPTLDCSGPINASIVAAPITDLTVGAYYIQNPVKMSINGRILRGTGSSQLPAISTIGGPGVGAIDPAATQIVLTSSSAHGVVVGTLQSAKPSAFVQNCVVRDMDVVRATADVPLGVTGATAINNPASGFSLFNSPPPPCGVVACWTELCRFYNVYTIEHSVGFYIYGTVVNDFNLCRSLRYTPGQNAGNDFWAGFFIDGSAPSGFNAGNASLYFERCGGFSNGGVVGGAPGYTFNAGLQAYSGYTDTYIWKFETSNCEYGLYLAGSTTSPPDFLTEDLIISDCVLDGCRFSCIEVLTGTARTAVQIHGCYMAPSNATGPVSNGLFIDNVHGSVNVTGCQFIGAPSNPAIGANLDISSGIQMHNNIYTDLSNPIVITSCVDLDIRDNINFAGQGPATAAIQVTGLTGGVIDTMIRAGTGITIPIGVTVDSTTTLLEVRATGIDKTNITAGKKLVVNGTQITAAGTYSWGLGQGIF